MVGLYSAAGNIVNSGLVNAVTGNITLSALAANQLNINNLGGTLSALNGSVNLRDASYTGSANTNLNGGNVLSQSVNLYTGNGVTNVDVDQLTGVVNASGYGAHVMTSSGELQIGNINVVDPTFYNDDGGISITGDITVQEDLTIAASGDITAGADSITISTQDGTGQGHDINLIAGADIDTTNCSGCTAVTSVSGTIPNGGGNVTGSNTITITGASSTGGNIDLTGATTNLTLNTSSTSANAGAINLIAFAAVDGSKGQVLLPANSSLQAYADLSGNGGAVTIIAGGTTTSPTIQIGSIDNTDASGALVNNILISTSQPNAGSGVTANSNGSLTGSFSEGTLNGAAQVSLLGTISASANVNFDTSHLAMGADSEVNANTFGANINFNGATANAITVTDTTDSAALNAANFINFNGGSGVGAVNVTVSSIGGSGYVEATGTSISISTLNLALSLGQITADTSVDVAAYGGSINVNNTVSGTSITMSANSSILETGGQLFSPSITLTASNFIGTNAYPLLIASNATTAGTVGLIAQAANVFLQDSLAADVVQFANISPANVSSGSTSFSLATAGDITAAARTLAVASPSLTLTTSGNIWSDASHPLSIASGATAGTLSLVAQTTGAVSLTDALATDVVQFNNTNALNVSSGGTSFSLTTAGNITASATTLAVTSPSLTLVTSNGNIWSDSTDALSVASGATAGTLSLVAQGTGNVALTDALATDVVQFNKTNALNVSSGGTSFSLTTAGNITASATTLAVTSPSLTLVTSNGNIWSDATDSLSIASTTTTASTVSLIAQASGAVSLTDTLTSDAVQFNNTVITGVASSGGTSFSLTAAGNITASATGLAVASPTISLATTSATANIGTSTSTALSVASNTNTAGILNLTIQAGGSAWLVDNLASDAVVLGNSSTGSNFQLTTAAALTVNNILAQAGSITVVNSTGGTNFLLQVNPSAHILAQGGNVTPVITAPGVILYGLNSILANTPTNTVIANLKTVTFNSTAVGRPVDAITLDGGVTVGAGTAPVSYTQNNSAADDNIVDTGEYADNNDTAEGGTVASNR